jgi:hypothetical protein
MDTCIRITGIRAAIAMATIAAVMIVAAASVAIPVLGLVAEELRSLPHPRRKVHGSAVIRSA